MTPTKPPTHLTAARHGDSPHADGTVGVTREEGVAVVRPAEREARDGQGLLGLPGGGAGPRRQLGIKNIII